MTKSTVMYVQGRRGVRRELRRPAGNWWEDLPWAHTGHAEMNALVPWGHGGPPPALAKETPCKARVAGELRGMAPLQDLQPGRVIKRKEAIKGTTTGILSRSLHLQDSLLHLPGNSSHNAAGRQNGTKWVVNWRFLGEMMGQSLQPCVSGTRVVLEGEPEFITKMCLQGD